MNNSQTGLEILHPYRLPGGRVQAAIFDFDGTFSTLRCGWAAVMRPMMLEYIGGGQADDALRRRVDEYIDQSTGIQTVYQMRWLAEQVDAANGGDPGRDEWWYKDEYNRRLMQRVGERIRRLESGEDRPEQYLIAGAVDFLHMLREAGVDVYLASGTDHRDVLREAGILARAPPPRPVGRYAAFVGGGFFFPPPGGARAGAAACSKEAVLRLLLEEKKLAGDRLLVVGDGKVEIALGAACGAYALGAATDETALRGVNPVKRERLVKAGADAIVGDFTCLDALKQWLGL